MVLIWLSLIAILMSIVLIAINICYISNTNIQLDYTKEEGNF